MSSSLSRQSRQRQLTINVLLFGNITSSLTYPAIGAASYISIGNFLTRLESVVMALWVAGAFLKLSVYYYALALGSAQWSRLNDYPLLLFPSNVFFNYTIEFVLPLLLVITALIRKLATTADRL
ncbi:GerAB/ArcD/ProY family transporter [Paenibacillus cremeus]|uniref:GerAB/ArcD/ProY family transporter n=1 Tax=Paenibacillus cremeus TaxID=2163881 RepID=A0A559KGZ4_9BACL|nr:GerAB/ArcD/ProY family transporter [Paenibacillus cremeus]TVY11394.1 GerAB/ArcD/ProY family transporter [Paenibacillus cremeus]